MKNFATRRGEYLYTVTADSINPSEIIDRKYFQPSYTREPGGVLFEMATNGPRFTEDEDVEELVTSPVLPEWLEDEYETIEFKLPAFTLPSGE